MTAENLNTRRRAPAPAIMAFAALTLAGCGTTHIGEDWQCPPAQGARCVSVAAADPVARGSNPAARGGGPVARGSGSVARGSGSAAQGSEPAMRGADSSVRSAGWAMEGSPGNMEIVGPPRPSGGPSAHGQPVPAKPDAENRAGRREGCAVCRPFAFLARLLRGGSAGGGNPGAGPADSGPADSASADGGPVSGAPGEEEAQDPIAPDGPAAHADLRAPERIGRVWIAPYVDAGGVYREASWVRIVIAPADWKR